MKIVKALEDSDLLLKGVWETIRNEAKEQKGGFLSMLLGISGGSLLGNMLPGKGINRAGKGITRAVYRSKESSKKQKKLILHHPLTNFEIQKILL